MKHRGVGAGLEIPEPLVRYNPDDWVGPSNELEYYDPMPGRPHIRWSVARCKWARERIFTEEDFDRLLYGPDVEFPPESIIGRDITCMLSGHSEWRRQKV